MAIRVSTRTIPLLALPALLMIASLGPVANASTAPRAKRAAAGLQSFTADSHMLGARADGVIIAGTDHALKISFRGAQPVAPRSSRQTGDVSGSSPLETVTWPNLWDGISLTYRASSDGIAESIYTLAPGADAADIQLAYGTPVVLNADGSLAIRYQAGQLTESAPVAWQIIDGRRQPVDARFRIVDAFGHASTGSTVGFELGDHDPDRAVVIDPTLSWNWFVGVSADENASGVSVDAAGNVYVVGSAYRPFGAPVRAWSGSYDAYVVKFDTIGEVAWMTYLGGASADYGTGISVSAAGVVSVVGSSNASWGTPGRAFTAGGNDIFVAQLTTAGILQWNTFLGGAAGDSGTAITQDGSGNVIVTGNSNATWGTPVVPYLGSTDAVVVRLNASGVVTWSTFLGSAASDSGLDVEVAGTSVYVAGQSAAAWGLPLRAFSGGQDAFVARLNVGSGSPVWNTFLGSNVGDTLAGITVDGSGNVFVAGASIGTWGTPLRAHSGDYDAFAARLSSGGALQWNTFLGSDTYQRATGVALGVGGSLYVSGVGGAWGTPILPGLGGFTARLAQTDGALQWNTYVVDAGPDSPSTTAVTTDVNGLVYVVGETRVSWGSPVDSFTSGVDAYLVKFTGAGAPQWHTFFGTGVDDMVIALQVDSAGAVLITGVTNAAWGGSPIRAYSGHNDAFVAKYGPDGMRIWMTYLGGASNDDGQILALDPAGNVYVAGSSGSTWGTPIRPHTNGADAFVARLNSSGALLWHTFLGGPALDVATGLQTTPAGVVVTGPSHTTWGSPVRAYSGASDSFVAGLDANGVLIWNTFLGGSGNDSAARLSASADGTAHVIGYSSAAWGAPVNAFVGAIDTFVAEIGPAGALTWSTFLGGSGNDYGYAIAEDTGGHLYAVGSSTTTWGSPLNAHSIGTDSFVARLARSTGVLEWHTFMGSGGTTIATDVAVIGRGNVFVTGYSDGSFGPAWRPFTSDSDAFLAEVSTVGALQSTAFFGDAGSDVGAAVAVDPTGSDVFLGGYSNAAWGDTEDTYESYSGGLDGFIARIALDAPMPSAPVLLPFIMK